MVKLAFSEIDRPTGHHSCRAAQHHRPLSVLGHIPLATFTFSCVCRGLLPTSSASVLLRVFCLKYQPCVSTFCPSDKEPTQCARAQLGSVCACAYLTLLGHPPTSGRCEPMGKCFSLRSFRLVILGDFLYGSQRAPVY